jgi:hypothetical protein
MILSRVMDEIGDVADKVEGLHVYRWPSDEVTPPAALVGYPDITLDAAFQRGTDRWTGGLILAVDRLQDRSTRDKLSRLIEQIVPEFVAHDWQSCAYARLVNGQPDAFMIGAVEFAVYLFEIDIAGPGTEET